MQLRPYQEEAKQAVYKYFKDKPGKNPCVVLPTGAGKTPLLATICKDVVIERAKVIKKRQRVLVLSHVKELLEQAVDKIKAICPELSVGVYSAGLNSRDVDEDVIVAGIQSVYKKAYEIGRFDVIVVDEAHLIPLSGDGMYQTFLKDARTVNPSVRVVGLTATPFRTRAGYICTEDGFLNDVCYEATIPKLIEDGYLCPIRTRAVKTGMETSGLKIKMGEFVQAEVDALVSDEKKVRAVCSEIVMKAAKYNRNKVLLFASNVSHAEKIKEIIEEVAREECGIVTGATPSAERAAILKRFKDEPVDTSIFNKEVKPLKYLVNVNVLTTGFDNPKVDLVALIRPTASPGLYYQMVGRGLRLHSDKEYCLVLDFGQNIDRHGPIDALCIKAANMGKGSGTAPIKSCPRCELITLAVTRVCPDCGFEFPFTKSEDKVETHASVSDILSVDAKPVTEEKEVQFVNYYKHTKVVDGLPKYSIRVEYTTPQNEKYKEWICPEHQGYARSKFETWWRKRSGRPVPDTVEDALEIINIYGIAQTKKIYVRKKLGNPYDDIVRYELEKVKPQPAIFESQFNNCSESPIECKDCMSFKDGLCHLDIDNPVQVSGDSPVCTSYCLESDIPF